MTATTEPRNTPRRDAEQFSFPIAASTKILAGTIVALNASGYAVPGSTATTLRSIGVAEETIDNSGGGDGDLNVPIRRGCFRFYNSASSDAIANTDYGTTCYIVDNQTVAKTHGGNTRSAAGTVRGVDSAGVWVQF